MLHEEIKREPSAKARIKVCGIGGGGGNAVNRMIESGLSDVDFIAINTDAMDLRKSKAPIKLQIGESGLGAGAKPEVGRQACEGDRESVRKTIQDADMIFLATGLGGGTGTGASPIVAEEAANSGALVVAIVTLPFSYEGEDRMNNALAGLQELEKHVDSLIVVPNDRLAELSDGETRFWDAFHRGDEVLHNGVRAISELVTVCGDINLDFSDLRTVMESRGRALMGIGIAEGENRAMRAAQDAIICPLLEQSDIQGAKGVVINIRGGRDILMQEVLKVNNYIKSSIGQEAQIISGVVLDDDERPEIQVTVIAAGFPKKDPVEYIKRFTGETRQTPILFSKPPVEKVRPPEPLPEAIKVAPEPKPPVEKATPIPCVMSAKNTGQFTPPGQRELPLKSPPDAGNNDREKVNLRVPTYLRKAMEEHTLNSTGNA